MSSKSDKFKLKAFGLTILKNGHPDIRKIRKVSGAPEIHGNKMWKSTLLLMDYLKEFPPPKKAKVLDIGCGWGLAGIYCAKQFKANVTSLDADDTVFPYLLHHAEINEVEVKPWKCRYEDVRKTDLREFDLVVGADICFWDSMVKPLYNLVKRAHQVERTRVVITDPGRPTYQAVAEKCVAKLGAGYDDWSVPHPHNASGLVLDLDPNDG